MGSNREAPFFLFVLGPFAHFERGDIRTKEETFYLD